MNGWSTDWTMKKNGNVFSYTATIDAGTYQYKYIVDGEWTTDPFNNNTANDDSGNTNSTFTVTATGTTTPDNPSTNVENPSTEDQNPSTEDEKPSTEDEKPSVEDEKPGTEDKNDAATDDKNEADQDTTTGTQPMSTGALLAIAIIVTVVVVLGGFAIFMYIKKKNA